MGLADDPKTVIQNLGPRRVVVDGDVVETHSLKDVIEWDKYTKSGSTANAFRRIGRAKFTQPGSQSRFQSPGC